MKIDRMDLADFGSPEMIVQGILDLVPDLPIPVPIEELARALNIVDIAALETEGFEGGLLTDENKAEGIILVNEASPRKRRRFTTGHELGHFLCPWHIPQTLDGFLCSAEDMLRGVAGNVDRASQMEIEANRFAALLLMPKPHFCRDLRKRRGVDIDHIIVMARDYDTSKEATTRRYVDLHDEPCAAVVSCRGRILRIYRQNSFPFIEVSSDRALPSQSFSTRADLAEGIVTDWQEVDAAAWLASERGRQLPSLYEQALPQRDGYRLTLLSIEETDSEDEEDALSDSWTPRFRR